MSRKIKHKCTTVFMPLLLSLAVGVAALTPLAQADTLLINKVLKPGPGQTVPHRGMSMRQVESQFGPPYEIIPTIGKPPITRWAYKNFVVYFEYEHVIHSVIKRQKP